jgi:ribosomal protein S18 acetylase RimI-like enzyme
MPVNYTIQLYKRPNGDVTDAIVNLTKSLSPTWFTPNVPEDTRYDLLFHDAFCLWQDNTLISCLVFTSWNGCLHISFFATNPDFRNQGWGTILLTKFCNHALKLGFKKINVLTVPPDIKPIYEETVRFYKNHGFVLTRRYSNLWEHDAIELEKTIGALH